MVKNITIKDEAYKYLKSKKGNRSFSDVILARKKREVKEQQVAYGETMIPVSHETKQILDEMKGTTLTYDDVIRKVCKKPSKSYLTLKKHAGTIKEQSIDYEAMQQWRKNGGRG